MSITPKILGKWNIDANGYAGLLNVTALNSGTLAGTLFNNQLVGFWDADARKITFARVPPGEAYEAFQVFTGYWFLCAKIGPGQVDYEILVGSFEVFQGNAHRSVFGWYAGRLLVA